MASFEFQETSDSLNTRIDIHKRFGLRDMTQWILEKLGQANGLEILDSGCGLGDQCILFNQEYPDSNIVGLDTSPDLWTKARERTSEKNLAIRFIEGSIDDPLPFESESFDLVTCIFAVYYAKDVWFSIREMHRVLKLGGRIFLAGPDPDNKPEFFEIQTRLTGRPTPYMPGRGRFRPEGLEACRDLFADVEYHTLENPLVFHEPGPFVDYVRSSVVEDRLLWKDLLPDAQSVDRFCNLVAEEARSSIAQNGNITITKVVGGILGTK